MKRDTLTQFFRGAVLAALPLVAAGCSSAADDLSGDGGGPPICEDGGFEGTHDLSATPCAISSGGIVVVLDGGLGSGGCTRCPQSPVTCQEERNAACEPILVCAGGCVGGRTPAGLTPARAGGATTLGRYFAQAAHAEAASVPAFRRLRSELQLLGAPRRLLDACRVAARDEIRHARSAARLARRFGTTPPTVDLAAPRARSAMALAIENAREGCVAEMFAALIATWQRSAAADPEVRAHLDDIVADETSHAELAWAIDAWLRRGLTASQRAHLHAVRLDALARLAIDLDVVVDDELQRVAGVPPPIVARALHRALAREIERRA